MVGKDAAVHAREKAAPEGARAVGNIINTATNSDTSGASMDFFLRNLPYALIFITALMIYFVVRYSRKRNPQATDIEGHTGLEIAWTVIPLVLFLSMFYFG